MTYDPREQPRDARTQRWMSTNHASAPAELPETGDENYGEEYRKLLDEDPDLADRYYCSVPDEEQEKLTNVAVNKVMEDYELPDDATIRSILHDKFNKEIDSYGISGSPYTIIDESADDYSAILKTGSYASHPTLPASHAAQEEADQLLEARQRDEYGEQSDADVWLNNADGNFEDRANAYANACARKYFPNGLSDKANDAILDATWDQSASHEYPARTMESTYEHYAAFASVLHK